jgi:hypothetical protein
VPYQSGSGRRNNVQLGVGQSIWAGSPPPAIPERVLDGIPGFAAWLALLLSITFAVAFPRLMLWVAVIVALYAAFRFLIAGFANALGLRKIKRWEKIDWCDMYQKHAPPDALKWEDVRHVVIIPNYKEPAHVLAKTLDSLAAQHGAADHLIIVLAMEAAETGCAEKAEALRRQYAPRFHQFYATIHPRGLPNEMQSKSANQAWAARWIRRRLVDELGYHLDQHPRYDHGCGHALASASLLCAHLPVRRQPEPLPALLASADPLSWQHLGNQPAAADRERLFNRA